MGFFPGKGLGKYLQGRANPVSVHEKLDRGWVFPRGHGGGYSYHMEDGGASVGSPVAIFLRKADSSTGTS